MDKTKAPVAIVLLGPGDDFREEMSSTALLRCNEALKHYGEAVSQDMAPFIVLAAGKNPRDKNVQHREGQRLSALMAAYLKEYWHVPASAISVVGSDETWGIRPQIDVALHLLYRRELLEVEVTEESAWLRMCDRGGIITIGSWYDVRRTRWTLRHRAIPALLRFVAQDQILEKSVQFKHLYDRITVAPIAAPEWDCDIGQVLLEPFRWLRTFFWSG